MRSPFLLSLVDFGRKIPSPSSYLPHQKKSNVIDKKVILMSFTIISSNIENLLEIVPNKTFDGNAFITMLPLQQNSTYEY